MIISATENPYMKKVAANAQMENTSSQIEQRKLNWLSYTILGCQVPNYQRLY